MTERILWLFIASFLVAVAAFTVYEDKFDGDEFQEDPYETDNNYEERQGKLLFPFVSIVRFANVDCSSTNTMNGTCLARRECNNLNGTITGVCASRRGRCCIVSRTCGTTTNVNNTYFSSPGYPAAYSGGQTCTIIVNRCNSNICQWDLDKDNLAVETNFLFSADKFSRCTPPAIFPIRHQPPRDTLHLRIDFLDMVLAQPNGDGVCSTDSITITGGNTIVPILCGDNTGQTLFVDFNGNAAITISITATLATTFSRRWNVRLIQLGCDCPGIAPNGCLQYYTGQSGTINSFNYGTSANTALSTSLVTGTRQLVNLNYGICIRMEAGYCSIQYSQASNDVYSFTVTGDVEGADTTVLGTTVGAVSGTSCTTDFVVIPNPLDPSTLVPVGTDRFCGIGFTSVVSASKPFVLYVVTDGSEGATATTPPDVANRGFSLTYTEIAC